MVVKKKQSKAKLKKIPAKASRVSTAVKKTAPKTTKKVVKKTVVQKEKKISSSVKPAIVKPKRIVSKQTAPQNRLINSISSDSVIRPALKRELAATVTQSFHPAIDYINVNKHFDDRYQLPNHYGETVLTLLARDPQWIYAYWEIGEDSLNRVREKIGDEIHHAAYVLRVYDITYVDFNGFNANHSFEIEVGRDRQNWYINLWNDNSSYCVELGLRTRDGHFWKIARSNSVQTPRAHPSYRGDLIWLEVAENKQFNPFVYVSYRRGNNGGLPKRRRFFLTDEELRNFFSRYFQMLKQLIWKRWQSQGEVGDEINIEGTDVYLDDLLEAGDIDGITQKVFLGSSEEWQKLLKRRRKAGMGNDELTSIGASENVSSGSWQLGQKQDANQRKFFFEIGTELIVYGRTEPDAQVTLEGKPVILRPDGTFSMRFALTDGGHIPLDFKAHSSNQIDKRQITTAVTRAKTNYKSTEENV